MERKRRRWYRFDNIVRRRPHDTFYHNRTFIPKHQRQQQQLTMEHLREKDGNYITVLLGSDLSQYTMVLLNYAKCKTTKHTKTLLDILHKIVNSRLSPIFRKEVIEHLVMWDLINSIVFHLLNYRCKEEDVDINDENMALDMGDGVNSNEDDTCQGISVEPSLENTPETDHIISKSECLIKLVDFFSDLLQLSMNYEPQDKLNHLADKILCSKEVLEIVEYTKLNRRNLFHFHKDIIQRRPSGDDFEYIYDSIIPTDMDFKRPSFAGLEHNLKEGAYDNKDHYLKTHFKLLREDLIIPIRDGIKLYRESESEGWTKKRFDNVLFHKNIDLEEKVTDIGLAFIVKNVQRHSMNTKYGSLLIFSNDNFQTVFCAEVTSSETPVQVTFPKRSLREIQSLLSRGPIMMGEPTTGYYRSASHVLQALQCLEENEIDIPFARYLIHCEQDISDNPHIFKCSSMKNHQKTGEASIERKQHGSETPNDVKVCNRSANPDLCKRLHDSEDGAIAASSDDESECLENQLSQPKEKYKVEISPEEQCDSDAQSHNEANIDSLDEFQREAFEAAVTKELSIIQGPPGCGKTFVGLKVVEELSKHVPQIMIVCYTNHALDQFLEQIITKLNIRNVIRLGGRSKSSCMEAYTLMTERRKNQSNFSKFKRYRYYEDKRLVVKKIEVLLKDIVCLKRGIPNFDMLVEEMDVFADQFYWRFNTNINKNSLFLGWLFGRTPIHNNRDIMRHGDVLTNEEVGFATHIFDPRFSIENRLCLYRHWIKKKLDKLYTMMYEFQEHLDYINAKLKEINDVIDQQIIQDKQIIALTTSKAAEVWEIINAVGPQVVIVEEAAEVFEGHLLASLSPKSKQLVMIGDHKQLRPKPSVYKLETDYNMTISMFERLVNNGLPYSTLRVQHRMRPEISKHVKYFYDELEDHSNVLQYGSVKGMLKNVFWIDHSHKEDDHGDSFTNLFESEYITHLCGFLLLQNYHPKQITVLTMYKGQMQNLRHSLKALLHPHKLQNDDADSIRVDTVDNFQGEENDIVILSLVRSNLDGRIGFLKEDNRICVALSRAKVGLYILGNCRTICQKRSKAWKHVYECLRQQDCVSTKLTLICQNHAGEKLHVASPKDFLEWPSGGCKSRCPEYLSCGHQCPDKCHPYLRDHSVIKCPVPCNKTCKHEHACKNKCQEICTIDLCEENITVLLERCGHIAEMKCFEDTLFYRCDKACGLELPCGHICEKPCSSDCKQCEVNVKYQRTCGHIGNKKCCEDENADKCSEHVIINRKCGHSETLHCHRQSKPCEFTCERILNCGHCCERKCYEQCSHFQCKTVVTYVRGCGHQSDKKCFQEADFDKCCESVTIERDPCGHIEKVACHEKTKSCQTLVPYIRSCGHRGKRMCYMSGDFETCDNIVTFIRQDCGHVGKKKCTDPLIQACEHICGLELPCGHKCTSNCDKKEHISLNENGFTLQHCPKSHKVECLIKCESILSCGHVCGGTCGVCRGGTFHKQCQQQYTGYLPCGHKYDWKCYEDIIKIPCAFGCRPTEPPEETSWPIPIASRTYTPCDKLLNCGHKCIGLKDERCPSACYYCHQECFKGFPNSQFVQIRDCGDVIDVEIMDKYMEDDSAMNTLRKCCPVCESPITKSIPRYSKEIDHMWKRIQEENDLISHVKQIETENHKAICQYFKTKGIVLKKGLLLNDKNDAEREFQRQIDCNHLVKVIKGLENEDLVKFENTIVEATSLVALGVRYTEELHETFCNVLRDGLSTRADLDDLMKVKFEASTEQYDEPVILDNEGVHQVKIFTQLIGRLCSYGKPGLPKHLLKQYKGRKVGVSYRSIAEMTHNETKAEARRKDDRSMGHPAKRKLSDTGTGAHRSKTPRPDHGLSSDDVKKYINDSQKRTKRDDITMHRNQPKPKHTKPEDTRPGTQRHSREIGNNQDRHQGSRTSRREGDFDHLPRGDKRHRNDESGRREHLFDSKRHCGQDRRRDLHRDRQSRSCERNRESSPFQVYPINSRGSQRNSEGIGRCYQPRSNNGSKGRSLRYSETDSYGRQSQDRYNNQYLTCTGGQSSRHQNKTKGRNNSIQEHFPKYEQNRNQNSYENGGRGSRDGKIYRETTSYSRNQNSYENGGRGSPDANICRETTSYKTQGERERSQHAYNKARDYKPDRNNVDTPRNPASMKKDRRNVKRKRHYEKMEKRNYTKSSSAIDNYQEAHHSRTVFRTPIRIENTRSNGETSKYHVPTPIDLETRRNSMLACTKRQISNESGANERTDSDQDLDGPVWQNMKIIGIIGETDVDDNKERKHYDKTYKSNNKRDLRNKLKSNRPANDLRHRLNAQHSSKSNDTEPDVRDSKKKEKKRKESNR